MMLNIKIPDEIDEHVSSITDKKEEFVIAAIKQKIATTIKTISSEELANECRDSREENSLLMEDIKHVDKKNWDDY